MAKNIIDDEVKKICKLLKDGRHDSYKTCQTDPFKMIQSYVLNGYEEEINIKKIMKNQTSFHIDEGKYGTLKSSEVKDLVIEEVQDYLGECDVSIFEKISNSIDVLIENNAIFGFDGSGQNASAAPSATLLVLDTKSTIIYNIDLNPCLE